MRLPRELHSKTNAIVLLITALTRSRQSWHTYEGGEPVQVSDNCQLCPWLLLLFCFLFVFAFLNRTSLCRLLCHTLMIAFKTLLPAEDSAQTQRGFGRGFSMLTVVDYSWKHWRSVITGAKRSTDKFETRDKEFPIQIKKGQRSLENPRRRLCKVAENFYDTSTFWQKWNQTFP